MDKETTRIKTIYDYFNTEIKKLEEVHKQLERQQRAFSGDFKTVEEDSTKKDYIRPEIKTALTHLEKAIGALKAINIMYETKNKE